MRQIPILDAAPDRANALRDFIAAPDFPCVGAKSALARDRLAVVEARDITSAWNDLHLHRELEQWVEAYRDDDEGLRSLAVVFGRPRDLSEAEFETALWERLQSLADKDAWKGRELDESVSASPTDPDFSVSFGGMAFFVVGLHPNSSRPARRFAYPTIIFNLHDQFERLRESGHYSRMSERIRDRDIALAGSENPMLAPHGEESAARQYSGRAVGDDWRCPFRDPRA